MENKYKNSKKKTDKNDFSGGKNKQTRSRVLSLAQLLSRVRKQRGFSGSFGSQTSNSITNTLPLQSREGLRNSAGLQNREARNSQFGTNGNAISSFPSYGQGVENKGKGRSFVEGSGRDKIFSSTTSGSITKAQMRMESQKEEQKRQKPIKPIIPPKSLVIILREKPEKILYNRRIIDYKHCGLLQRYIGLGGKILPRRQTRLTAKQQRYIAKTIKSARIMGLLPFVSKEKGYFR